VIVAGPQSGSPPPASFGPIGLAEYERFRRHVLVLAGVDLDQYKREQLLRRLGGLRQRVGVRDLEEYAQRLHHDPAELERFRGWFTINVTEFFRDPDRWVRLRDQVLPALLAERRQLRIWSAGCSHGAEVYSLLMLLDQYKQTGPHHLLATDIDPAALATARAGGPYAAALVQNVGATKLSTYFEQGPDGWYVRAPLRARPTFREADLLHEPIERDFDLIVCRNVVIYFTEPAKLRVQQHFAKALRPDGILFTGATELIPRGNPQGFEHVEPSFYRR
jgi:chemotaxis protein methyltransferase CheR